MSEIADEDFDLDYWAEVDAHDPDAPIPDPPPGHCLGRYSR